MAGKPFLVRLFEEEIRRNLITISSERIDLPSGIASDLSVSRGPDGKLVATIFIDRNVKKDDEQSLFSKQLARLHDPNEHLTPTVAEMLKTVFVRAGLLEPQNPVLSLSSILIPAKKLNTGLLIESVSRIWDSIVAKLIDNWTLAYEIEPHVWEEIVAGAFSKAGYEEVVLTPRSGDFGRDVIAIRKGVGCVKIIGSVKAYSPHHLVKHDDVRALLGVMSGELDTSKAMITTTSDFAPRIRADPFIKPFLPTRLELVNGEKLREWLLQLAVSR